MFFSEESDVLSGLMPHLDMSHQLQEEGGEADVRWELRTTNGLDVFFNHWNHEGRSQHDVNFCSAQRAQHDVARL